MGDYRPTRRSVRQLAGADRQRPSYCDGRHRGYTLVSGRASCPLRNRGENAMPKYVIERDIPGAGKLSSQELKAISQKSCGVLSNKIGRAHSELQSLMRTSYAVFCSKK